jgi:hypothetical protein
VDDSSNQRRSHTKFVGCVSDRAVRTQYLSRFKGQFLDGFLALVVLPFEGGSAQVDQFSFSAVVLDFMLMVFRMEALDSALLPETIRPVHSKSLAYQLLALWYLGHGLVTPIKTPGLRSITTPSAKCAEVHLENVRRKTRVWKCFDDRSIPRFAKLDPFTQL